MLNFYEIIHKVLTLVPEGGIHLTDLIILINDYRGAHSTTDVLCTLVEEYMYQYGALFLVKDATLLR